MNSKNIVAAAAAVALLGGLAACSTVDTVEPQEAPRASAPASPSAEPSDASDTDTELAARPGDYVDYYEGALDETPGTKVLFFHASWCPKCRALDEDILANTVPDDMTIFKVDFDTATELKVRYGVTLQTTIVYVDDDGDATAKGVLFDDTTLAALIAAAP